MPEVAYPNYRCTFNEALAEFAPKHRDAVLKFASKELWWRRITTRVSPALALQLAIDPALENARRLLDACAPIEDIEEAAGLEVSRHTRPAQLRVVGRKVRLAKSHGRRTRTRTANEQQRR